MEKVYEFMYTSCIHESAMATISIHKTRKGAELAMLCHQQEARKEFDRMDYEEHGFKFGEYENWQVCETEVLD